MSINWAINRTLCGVRLKIISLLAFGTNRRIAFFAIRKFILAKLVTRYGVRTRKASIHTAATRC